MSEGRLFVGLIWSTLTWVFFVLCYRYGGWRIKVARRFIGGVGLPASLCGLSLFTHTFHWWQLLSLVSYPLWLLMGYGADTTAQKLWRRLLYGLVGALAGLPLLWGLWPLVGWHIFVCVGTSLIAGVMNPLTATGEEGLLAGVFVMFVVFTPLR